jgi:rod shape determining protein RodA
MNFVNYFKKFDWILIGATVLLCSFGLASIYSSSLKDEGFTNFQKQIFFFIVGMILMFVLSSVNWKIFRENSYLILILYCICLVLLIGLFFFASEIRGVRSWYKIGTFSIDPMEFAKIVLIILLAKYFSTRHIELYQIRHILLSGFYVFLPAVLIFLQPDLGSVIILVALWVGVLIISGIKLRHFLIMVFIGLLLSGLCWNFLLKDYQKERVMSFASPTDPLGSGWSQIQSKIAIGSGGIFGEGFGSGSQTQYGFLPEPQTDFIFAAIAEETGLVGIFALLSLYLIMFWRVFKIMLSSQSNFPRLFAMGFIIVIISQIIIHIGMNLGLLPIIGISLPLVSYGGSGLISTLAAFGILQNIRNNP